MMLIVRSPGIFEEIASRRGSFLWVALAMAAAAVGSLFA